MNAWKRAVGWVLVTEKHAFHRAVALEDSGVMCRFLLARPLAQFD
jgi:hypothetical protein